MTFRNPEDKHLTIIVNHHGSEYSAKIPWDCGLDEAMLACKNLLIMDGYPAEQLTFIDSEELQDTFEANEYLKQKIYLLEKLLDDNGINYSSIDAQAGKVVEDMKNKDLD